MKAVKNVSSDQIEQVLTKLDLIEARVAQEESEKAAESDKEGDENDDEPDAY